MSNAPSNVEMTLMTSDVAMSRHRLRQTMIQWLLAMMRRLAVVVLMLIVMTTTNKQGFVSADCQFPSAWHGSWYQSGLGEIIISAGYITHKGACYEHHRDYFLVENRQDNCRQCLLMMSRHSNVIQYKESFCLGPESIHTLCSKIRVEAVLYTLVREPSQPVACPFQTAAFHFVYNNNSGGFCRHPISYVHRCAADSKFHFSFKRCHGFAYTNDRDLELECLATWKDGSDTFFYGEFASEGLVTKEETYRCFMYRALGNVVFLSMSADATCRGLRTPQDGPLIMELTEDPAVAASYWPGSNCRFPGWLTAVGPGGWRDLSGKHRYTVRNNGTTLTFATRRPTSLASPASPSSSLSSPSVTSTTTTVITHLLASYQCIRQFNEITNDSVVVETSGRSVYLMTHVRDDCLTRIQCLRIQQRDFHVVQLQKGSYTDNGRCTVENFANLQSNQLLVSADLPSVRSCPFVGKYHSSTDETGCKLEVIAGCSDRAQLDVWSSCQSRPVLQLMCVLWWSENNKLLLLAHESHKDDTGRLFCYSIQQLEATIEITSDRGCSQETLNSPSGSSSLHSQYTVPAEVYTFQNYLDECPVVDVDPPPHQLMTILRTLDDQANDQLAAGAYSHVISDEPSKPGVEHSMAASVASSIYEYSSFYSLLWQLLTNGCSVSIVLLYSMFLT